MSPKFSGFFRRATGIVLFLVSVWAPVFLAVQASAATSVLIYYDSDTTSTETMTHATNILTTAGAQVTSLCVTSASYCPTNDNWGSYNQVWDLRVGSASTTCPTVGLSSESFSPCWQTQSMNYLQSGGNLYLCGEFDAFRIKNTGISDFLIMIGAVQPGYTECPSVNGNGVDSQWISLPCNIPGQSASLAYYGEAMGGIPLPYLNGTNFVRDPTVAHWSDGVDRSIVSGWQGSAGQMTQLSGNVGNLVTVWDCNCLSFSSLSAAAQVEDTQFINAVYCYLGGGNCAVTQATSTPTQTSTATFTSTITNSFTPTETPTITSTRTETHTPTFTMTPTHSATPTITLTQTPTITPLGPLRLWPNPYDPTKAVRGTLKCADMPEGSSLTIYTVSGEKVFSAQEVGYRVEWDGKTGKGTPAGPGVYFFLIRRNQETLLKGTFVLLMS